MSRLSAAIGLSLLLVPSGTLAHEHQTFRIGEKTYSFTVGSINEPVTVDDKSGVEVAIEEMVPAAAHDEHEEGDEHPAGTPAVGLEKTLKVEVSAGDKKKEMDLRPAFGEPGTYRAVFYPTVQTTFTYRLFGTINNVPVDLSFTCNPAGHPQVAEDNMQAVIADGVTRIAKSGAFGCPTAKADLGFPEPALTLNELQSSSGGGWPAIILGALGTLLGGLALMKKRA